MAGTVLAPDVVPDGTDWGSLEHAYGPASDAPAHLVMLLSEDAGQCGEVLAHHESAILHQGTTRCQPQRPPGRGRRRVLFAAWFSDWRSPRWAGDQAERMPGWVCVNR